MHLNRNVLVGLAVVALAVLAVAPQSFGAILPLLILALCPLSMIFMMRGMGGHGQAHGGGCHGDHGAHESPGAASQQTTTAAPREVPATGPGDTPDACCAPAPVDHNGHAGAHTNNKEREQ